MKYQIQGLQLILNTIPPSPHPCLELALQAILGGADSLQFRHKGTYTREYYALACQLAKLCQSFSIPLIVNDRLDIAIAVQAAGVHLGQTDLPIKVARHLLGEDKLIGATASTFEQAKRAEREGADYIGFGHIFATKTKVKYGPPIGLSILEEVCKHIKIPVLAIGGINASNVDCVCQTGVSGIALVSAISFSSNPLKQTRQIKTRMSSYEKSMERVISS